MLKPLTIPAACENRLRLGTCSWKYDSWKGLVYDVDKDYQAGDYLADYARYYGSVEVFGEFLESLDPMKENLGPIMLQFEYLNKTKMPSLNIFLERMANFFQQVPTEYNYAIEIRNPNYLKNDLFAFMKQYQIGMVLLEGY